MARPSAIVTDAELLVLDYLWEHGPSSVRDVSHGIYEKNTAAYHSTVNSLMDQLEAKGYVARDRSGFAHVFSAKVERETVVGLQLQQLADSHFDGVLTPMLLALVERVKLKPREREAIRKIIENIK